LRTAKKFDSTQPNTSVCKARLGWHLIKYSSKKTVSWRLKLISEWFMRGCVREQRQIVLKEKSIIHSQPEVFELRAAPRP
jgi:hypothetical protein